jgi:predicted transcriptional regulator
MASGGDGISYEWSVDAKLAGVDDGVKKLDAAIDSTSKLHHATEGLSGSTHELTKATHGHAAASAHASESAHKHKHEIEGVGEAVHDVKHQLHEFGEAIGAVLAFELVKEGIEKIQELGSEILHTAAAAERMGLALKLTVGEEGSKEVLEWIEKIGSKTEFTQDQLKGWASSLLNAGVQMKDLDKFMAAGMDVAAKGGDAGAAMEALRRAQLSGHVSGRQLMGLNLGIDQIKQLPGFAGLSDEKAHKQLEKTEVTKDQLLSMIAGADGVLGDMAVQAGGTMNAKLKNLASLPELYFEKFAGSPAFEIFKTKLSEIFDALDPSSPRGEMIFKSLEGAVIDIVNAIARIDFVAVADTIKDDIVPAFQAMTSMIKPTVDAILQMIEGLKFAAKLIHDFTPAGFAVDQMKKSSSVMGGMQARGELPSQQKHEGALGSTVDFMNVHTPVGFMNDTLFNPAWYKARFGKGSEEAGKAVADGMSTGIESNMSSVADSSSALGDVSIDAMSSKIDAHSPSRVFEELGRNTGEGFVSGIEKSQGAIDDVMKGAFAVPTPGGAGAGGGLGGGQVSISIPVTVTAHPGQSAEETGREIGEQIREIVLPMLINALEQAGAEAGA